MSHYSIMKDGVSRWTRYIVSARVSVAVLALLSVFVFGQGKASAEDLVGPPAKLYSDAVANAVGYLRTSGQAEDGSFSKQAGPGVSALVLAGLLRTGTDVNDPLVARGMKYLEGFVQPDGGIYAKESRHANYETCLALVAFHEANKDGRYKELIKKAEAFVKNLQWDEGESHDPSSVNYGGAGYGNSRRPDLSNTSFLLEALHSLGDGPKDPAVERALVFVSRCQNLETEYNTTEFAAKNPDGGFYYTCAAGGSSQAGATPDGGLRSYGSMTYAGLKSMIYAGVGPDDPRVKAATEWVRKFYTLTENPGMQDAGLFYYYHTFSKALDALQQDEFVDAKGQKHDWRRELAEELAKKQRENGSWLNENSRWLEGDANLVTGYALLAISYCKPRPATK